jgi:hypothetical protein
MFRSYKGDEEKWISALGFLPHSWQGFFGEVVSVKGRVSLLTLTVELKL